jgi:hypothetical protein
MFKQPKFLNQSSKIYGIDTQIILNHLNSFLCLSHRFTNTLAREQTDVATSPQKVRLHFQL